MRLNITVDNARFTLSDQQGELLGARVNGYTVTANIATLIAAGVALMAQVEAAGSHDTGIEALLKEFNTVIKDRTPAPDDKANQANIYGAERASEAEQAEFDRVVAAFTGIPAEVYAVYAGGISTLDDLLREHRGHGGSITGTPAGTCGYTNTKYDSGAPATKVDTPADACCGRAGTNEA